MKLYKIYVAGSYSATNVIDVLQNIGRGEKICAKLFFDGFAPFCPWHDQSYAKDACYKDIDVSLFYDYSMIWLEVSDAVYVISGVGNGGGVDAEIARATKLSIPVFYSYNSLLAWRKHQ